MNKLGEIRVTQRTALGHDQSDSTKVYVVKGVHSLDDIEVMDEYDAKEMVRECGSVIIGYYEIIHPWLLAGSWEENLSDFCRMAQRRLDEDDLVKYNDYGVAFLK